MKKIIVYFLLLCLFLFLLIPINSVYGQIDSTLIIRIIDINNFPNVNIFFSAVDSSGLPIEDLKQEDIEFKENDKIIADYSLESLTSTTSPIYIALLLDSSGSMRGNPLVEAKEAAVDFINSLKDIDEVKVFVFNDRTEYIQDFTNDKDTLINAINGIEVEGSNTVLYDAVYDAAVDLKEKPIGNRAIVLLTDGKDDSATSTIEDAIAQAKENKIPIYSIGFGKNFDKDSANYDEEAYQALFRLSKQTGGNFFIAGEENLSSNFSMISDILKYQYSLIYKSELLKDGSDYSISISITSIGEVARDDGVLTTPTFEVLANLDNYEDDFNVDKKVDIVPNIEISPDKYKVEEEIIKVEYYLDSDSVLIEEVDNFPFAISLDPEKIDYGKHTLIAKIYDNLNRVYSIEKTMNITKSLNAGFLIYIISGSVLALAIIAAVVFILLKRRKRRKAMASEGFEFESGGKDFMTENEEGGTWPGNEEGGDTLFEEGLNGKDKGGQGIGTGTVIIRRKEFIPMAWLTAIKGYKEGTEYEIPPKSDPGKRRITIGRNTYNDVVIDDETVSRDQAFIIIEKNYYKIGDAGSANGTFVNDKKISSLKTLKDGDKIGIGDNELIFKTIKFKKEKNNIPKKKSKKNKKSKK